MKKTDPSKEDFKDLSLVIIKNIRGDYSQEQINRRLDFNYNQVSKWEVGRHRIKWDDFILLMKACNKDVLWILRNSFAYYADDFSWNKFAKFIIDDLMFKVEGNYPMQLSKKRLNFFLKDESSNPYLWEVLLFLNFYSHFFYRFLNDLCSGKSLPKVFRKKLELMNLIAKLIAENPSVSPVLACVKLEKYKNSPLSTVRYMQEYLGINKKRIEKFIDTAIELNILSPLKSGKHKLVRDPFSEKSELTSDFELTSAILPYHAKLSAKISTLRYKKLETEKGYFYDDCGIIMIDKKNLKELQEITNQYSNKVRELSTLALPPYEKMLFFNMVLFDDDFVHGLSTSIEVDD